ncbi:MFS transporter, partial [Candidatus Fermentibacterales bacterium]|nr:MFS transporter [Candidatus Fermentibacterales bacterium]
SFAQSMRSGIGSLVSTLRKLRQHTNAMRFLLSFLVYNDGVQTVIIMATIFARSVLGLGYDTLIGALLLTQAVGVPGSILYGRAARRFGAKKSILAGIVAYIAIVTYAFRMKTAAEFWVLAGLVGLFQGGIQAISRSLYSRLIPESMSSEFFGFFAISSRFASVFGPLVFALIGDLTGSIRLSILAMSALFVVGLLLLLPVREPPEEPAFERSA